MELPAVPASPVRDVHGRLRRLSAAIDDRDSTLGQRVAWREEYAELRGELVGRVGARAADAAELLDRSTRRVEPPDGRTPRVPPRESRGVDVHA